MKLIKTIKYQLTKETLEKDIEKFISYARRGDFSWDNKFENEGLKIIKQYFKILKEKFDNNELQECKICYEKLILFLFDASRGDDKANFDYTDLLFKISSNFDNYINNYFICLIKTCGINELSERVSNYAAKLKDYGFESDKKTLFKLVKKEEFAKLEELMLKKIENMTKKDEDKQGILFFLISLAEMQKDKIKYFDLCKKFKGILDDKDLECLKEEYIEDEQ